MVTCCCLVGSFVEQDLVHGASLAAGSNGVIHEMRLDFYKSRLLGQSVIHEVQHLPDVAVLALSELGPVLCPKSIDDVRGVAHDLNGDVHGSPSSKPYPEETHHSPRLCPGHGLEARHLCPHVLRNEGTILENGAYSCPRSDVPEYLRFVEGTTGPIGAYTSDQLDKCKETGRDPRFSHVER